MRIICANENGIFGQFDTSAVETCRLVEIVSVAAFKRTWLVCLSGRVLTPPLRSAADRDDYVADGYLLKSVEEKSTVSCGIHCGRVQGWNEVHREVLATEGEVLI